MPLEQNERGMKFSMNRIKQLRMEKNLTQENIAKVLNVEVAAISKYETERVPLKDEYIKKLANFFNVTSDYLLCLSDVREPNTTIRTVHQSNIINTNGFSKEEIEEIKNQIEFIKWKKIQKQKRS